MKKTKVSIITPIFNGERYIENYIRCLARQLYSDIEVILVDDGSTDNTLDMCEKYARKDQRIKVFHKENGGPSSARNLGIENATGDYVVFFDIDDDFKDCVLSENEKIASSVSADVVLWNFKMVVMEKNKEIIRKIGDSFQGNSDSFFSDFLIPVLDNEMFNPPWNKMINREFLIENNIRFDERFSLYEDILFSCNVFKKARKIAVNDEVYYTYLIKKDDSLLTKLHKECFDAVSTIFDSAMDYCRSFKDNQKQIDRFEQQYVFLTKGHIKRICIDKGTGYNEKKVLLGAISDNADFISLLLKHSHGFKNQMVAFMMKCRMYHMIIFLYGISKDNRK